MMSWKSQVDRIKILFAREVPARQSRYIPREHFRKVKKLIYTSHNPPNKMGQGLGYTSGSWVGSLKVGYFSIQSFNDADDYFCGTSGISQIGNTVYSFERVGTAQVQRRWKKV